MSSFGLPLIAHFYPRPPRGGRLDPALRRRHHRRISIHALREEGDGRPVLRWYEKRISIHALREEGDWSRCWLQTAIALFLSTPSARRATWRSLLSAARAKHFYPRPPRGGRPDGKVPLPDLRGQISIHALREEGDVPASSSLIAYT